LIVYYLGYMHSVL